MKSKKLGDKDLKAGGLSGTWLPRGHFGETYFDCKNGHRLIHHDLVRGTHVVALKKNSEYAVKTHPKLSNSYRLLTKSGKTTSVRHDCIAYDYDDIVQYTVDASTGKVTVTCPVDGEVLMTYEPHQAFGEFDGELLSTVDGERI